YLEELVRQTLPNCKINNVVPHNGVAGDTVVNPCPVQDNVLYYGSFGKVGSGSPKIKTLNGSTCTFQAANVTPSGPLLVYGFDSAVVGGVYFSGWKIMVENPPVNPSTPTPPTYEALQGFKMLGVYDVDYNPAVSAAFVFGKLGEDSVLRFKEKDAADWFVNELTISKGVTTGSYGIIDDDDELFTGDFDYELRTKAGGVVLDSGTVLQATIPFTPFKGVTLVTSTVDVELNDGVFDFNEPNVLPGYNSSTHVTFGTLFKSTGRHYNIAAASVPSVFDIGINQAITFVVDGANVTRTFSVRQYIKSINKPT
ncbi:MAG: hypothetical protein J0I84_20315, partial [Terrimonas sp.]|nr:hypothetical protein [Terrimonas sp.]